MTWPHGGMSPWGFPVVECPRGVAPWQGVLMVRCPWQGVPMVRCPHRVSPWRGPPMAWPHGGMSPRGFPMVECPRGVALWQGVPTVGCPQVGCPRGRTHQHWRSSTLKPSGQPEGTGRWRLLLPTPQMMAEESTSL